MACTNKIIMIILIILVNTSCCGAVFREIFTPAEEKERIKSCIEKIEIYDDKSLTKPYSIIGTVSTTQGVGYDSYAFNELKRIACTDYKEVQGLIFPQIETGPWNSTYTSKVIKWKQ